MNCKFKFQSVLQNWNGPNMFDVEVQRIDESNKPNTVKHGPMLL